MILKTFDAKEMYISPEQADKIAAAIAAGTKLISVNGAYIAAGAIATILPGGVDPNQKTLPPPEPKPISDEQRKKNLARLAEMKREFLEKKVKSVA